MTPAQFAAYIRKKTKTNATTFSDADILMYANIIKDDLAKDVVAVNEDYFGMKFTRNLVAGKRNYRFPYGVLSQLKYAQAKIDGTNWKRLSEFDINTYQKTTDETSIRTNWAGKDPSFDIFGEELNIYSELPIIDVTEGLELWAIIYPKDLSSLAGTIDMSIPQDNQSFGVPRQLHYVWAHKVIIEYKTSKEKSIPLTEREVNINQELQLALGSLKSQNLDRTIVATVPDRSNNGEDY